MEFEKPKQKNSKQNHPVKHPRKPKQDNNRYLIAAAVGVVVIFIAAVLFGTMLKRDPRIETTLLPTLAVTDDNSAADSPSGRPTLPPVWTPTHTMAASP